MTERQRKNPQLDFLGSISKTVAEEYTSQNVHNWWFDNADEKFRELAQTFINFRGSTIARQAHLDVSDDISLEMDTNELSEELGHAFNSARSRGVSAEEIALQVHKRARDLERRSGIPGWSSPLTSFTIDILAEKWGLSNRKVQKLKQNTYKTTLP